MVGTSSYERDQIKLVILRKLENKSNKDIVTECQAIWPGKAWETKHIAYIASKYEKHEEYQPSLGGQPWVPKPPPVKKPRAQRAANPKSRTKSPPVRKPPTKREKKVAEEAARDMARELARELAEEVGSGKRLGKEASIGNSTFARNGGAISGMNEMPPTYGEMGVGNNNRNFDKKEFDHLAEFSRMLEETERRQDGMFIGGDGHRYAQRSHPLGQFPSYPEGFNISPQQQGPQALWQNGHNYDYALQAQRYTANENTNPHNSFSNGHPQQHTHNYDQPSERHNGVPLYQSEILHNSSETQHGYVAPRNGHDYDQPAQRQISAPSHESGRYQSPGEREHRNLSSQPDYLPVPVQTNEELQPKGNDRQNEEKTDQVDGRASQALEEQGLQQIPVVQIDNAASESTSQPGFSFPVQSPTSHTQGTFEGDHNPTPPSHPDNLGPYWGFDGNRSLEANGGSQHEQGPYQTFLNNDEVDLYSAEDIEVPVPAALGNVGSDLMAQPWFSIGQQGQNGNFAEANFGGAMNNNHLDYPVGLNQYDRNQAGLGNIGGYGHNDLGGFDFGFDQVNGDFAHPEHDGLPAYNGIEFQFGAGFDQHNDYFAIPGYDGSFGNNNFGQQAGFHPQIDQQAFGMGHGDFSAQRATSPQETHPAFEEAAAGQIQMPQDGGQSGEGRIDADNGVHHHVNYGMFATMHNPQPMDLLPSAFDPAGQNFAAQFQNALPVNGSWNQLQPANHTYQYGTVPQLHENSIEQVIANRRRVRERESPTPKPSAKKVSKRACSSERSADARRGEKRRRFAFSSKRPMRGLDSKRYPNDADSFNFPTGQPDEFESGASVIDDSEDSDFEIARNRKQAAAGGDMRYDGHGTTRSQRGNHMNGGGMQTQSGYFAGQNGEMHQQQFGLAFNTQRFPPPEGMHPNLEIYGAAPMRLTGSIPRVYNQGGFVFPAHMLPITAQGLRGVPMQQQQLPHMFNQTMGPNGGSQSYMPHESVGQDVGFAGLVGAHHRNQQVPLRLMNQSMDQYQQQGPAQRLDFLARQQQPHATMMDNRQYQANARFASYGGNPSMTGGAETQGEGVRRRSYASNLQNNGALFPQTIDPRAITGASNENADAGTLSGGEFRRSAHAAVAGGVDASDQHAEYEDEDDDDEQQYRY